jgi:hypothetical protein
MVSSFVFYPLAIALPVLRINIILLHIKQQWDWTKSYHNLWTVPTNNTHIIMSKKIAE